MLKKVLLCSLLVQSCITQKSQSSCSTIAKNMDECRPFRAGMFHTNRLLDSGKPLGAIDPAGWVLVDGLLIGSPSRNLLQGISMDGHQLKWQIELPGSVSAPIVSHEGKVIVGSRDGSVIKIDAKTGKSIWSKNIGRFVSREPVIHLNKVLVTAVDQKLFALDYNSGKTTWVYDAGTPSSLVISHGSKPSVYGGTVLLGTTSGDLHGVDVQKGKQLFVLDAGANKGRFTDIIGEVAVARGFALVSRYDGVVYAAQIATGKRDIVWKRELPGIANSQYRDGIYYISCLNGDLIALNASDGREIWKVFVSEPAASITVHQKVLYVGGTGGKIVAVRISDGLRLWSDDLEGSLTSRPVLSGDKIFYSTGLKVHYGYQIQ